MPNPDSLSDGGIVSGRDYWDRPYHYDTNSGTLTQLAMPPWYVAGFPSAPNIHGVGVGTVSQTPTGGGDAIRWNSPTDWNFLHMPNGSTIGSAYEINDHGAIRGQHGFGDDVFWLPGQVNGSYVRPFGRSVSVFDLTNTRGMIAADRASGPRKSYLINFDLSVEATIVNPLGANKSITLASLNEQGWAAGGMDAPFNDLNNFKAVIWSAQTGVTLVETLIDNPPSGFFINNAWISDSMMMYGKDNRDPLNPKFYILEPVPEPGALATLGLGVTLLIRRRRR